MVRASHLEQTTILLEPADRVHEHAYRDAFASRQSGRLSSVPTVPSVIPQPTKDTHKSRRRVVEPHPRRRRNTTQPLGEAGAPRHDASPVRSSSMGGGRFPVRETHAADLLRRSQLGHHLPAQPVASPVHALAFAFPHSAFSAHP